MYQPFGTLMLKSHRLAAWQGVAGSEQAKVKELYTICRSGGAAASGAAAQISYLCPGTCIDLWPEHLTKMIPGAI